MSNTVRIQDDLYEHVNGEWLSTAVIPDDKPMTGGFSTLDEEVEKTMMEDFIYIMRMKTSQESNFLRLIRRWPERHLNIPIYRKRSRRFLLKIL